MDSTPRPYHLPLFILYPLLIAAGAMMVLSFAPFSWHWSLPFVLLLVFYQSVQGLTPRQGMLAGWCFGLGYFGLSINWIYNSIFLFGAASPPLAIVITFLLVLVLSLFPMLIVWVFLRLRSRIGWPLHALLFASLWALADLARGKILGGFPWALVGYSQTTDIFGALAPWIGVYGIGFVLVFLPNFLVDSIRHQWHSGIGRIVAATCGAVVCVATFFGLSALDKVAITEAKGTSLNVRLVQANIAQELKFSQERLESSIEQYTALSLQDLPDTDLIIWPETAIPTLFSNVERVIDPFAERLHAQGTEVLAGGFYRDDEFAYNSLRQLAGEKAQYNKRHLVPFGEYMPFRFALEWIGNFVEIPQSDMGRGTGPNLPMVLKGEPLGLTICYEDVFGEEVRELIPEATVLINVSNDAWFGEKVAPYQHQQKAQMRAREMVRPLIRVTNTGVSSVMDHKGQLQGSIKHSTQGFLDTTVYPRTGASLYARTGNWPVFILSMLIVITALVFRQRVQRMSKAKAAV